MAAVILVYFAILICPCLKVGCREKSGNREQNKEAEYSKKDRFHPQNAF